MPELPVISGQKAIKTLVKLGFVVVRQRGSHVFLQRGHDTVTVPLHNPLRKGTLKSILKQANVSLDDFLQNMKLYELMIYFAGDHNNGIIMWPPIQTRITSHQAAHGVTFNAFSTLQFYQENALACPQP